MKFEKISDNQIRCTLTKKDLLDRHLKLTELAYGNDKTNALFQDMIAQASNECNFHAEDIPLMIEAIPVSPDCLVLLITKVTDPDELDPRFSSFTSAPGEPAEAYPEREEKMYADEILNCFDHLSSILGDQLSAKLLGECPTDSKRFITNGATEGEASLIRNLSKIYSLDSLEEVIALSKIIHKYYHGENTLYKDKASHKYYLVVNLSEHTAGEFNKVCNIISEYGRTERPTAASLSYFEEHLEVIVRNKAVQVLYKM